MRTIDETRKKQVDNLRDVLRSIRERIFTPPSNEPLSVWVKNNYKLSPEASSQAGRYRTDLMPFQDEAMDAITDIKKPKVVIMSCSQLFKTQIMLCALIYLIKNDPGPTMVVNATGKASERFSKERLDIAIRDNGILELQEAQLSKSSGSGRSGVNTTHRKKIPGGSINLSSAGSVSDLASLPIRYLFTDETDRYEATSEGNPLELAAKRTTTFWNRKIVMTSSPGDEAVSIIYKEYKNSDMREWYVPCHICGYEQTLKWEQVKWADTKDPNDAQYHCEACDTKWRDIERKGNVQRGRWIAAKPNRPTAGFKINALCSPFVSIDELACEFVDSTYDIESLRTFVNTRLGEPWKDASNSITSGMFKNRVEPEKARIPDGVVLITCGVDVGEDHIHGSIYGWGIGDESWLLKHFLIKGDPTILEPWNELEGFLDTSFTREDGTTLKIHSTGVDCGHLMQEVLSFTTKNESKGVYAVKGVAGFDKPIFTHKASRSRKKRLKFYNAGVDSAKMRFYRQLAIEEHGPGYCHYPDTLDDAFFEELVSETLVTRYKRGRPVRGWQKKQPNLRGEALDCRIYAMVVRHSFTLDFEKRAEMLTKKAKKVKSEDKTKEKLKENKQEQPSSTQQIINNKRRPFKRGSRLLDGLGI